MNKSDFPPIYDLLVRAYPGRQPSDVETLDVFFVVLRDLETDLVKAAVLEFISSPSAFPPTPGQIREMAVRLTKRGQNVPSAAEAWEMVVKAPTNGITSWSKQDDEGGWHIYNQPYQWPHPIVEKVARNLGWPDRFWTDNLVSDRARFLQAYSIEEERATQEITSLPEVQAYIARGQSDIKQIMNGFRRDALDRGEGEG